MQRVVRGGVVACVCAVVVFSVVYLVRAVDRLGDAADANAAANYDDREFAGGNSLVVDKRALYQARALIPDDGLYRVVAGPRVEGATELTEPYIDQYARYFLMPRRPRRTPIGSSATAATRRISTGPPRSSGKTAAVSRSSR